MYELPLVGTTCTWSAPPDPLACRQTVRSLQYRGSFTHCISVLCYQGYQGECCDRQMIPGIFRLSCWDSPSYWTSKNFQPFLGQVEEIVDASTIVIRDLGLSNSSYLSEISSCHSMESLVPGCTHGSVAGNLRKLAEVMRQWSWSCPGIPMLVWAKRDLVDWLSYYKDGCGGGNVVDTWWNVWELQVPVVVLLSIVSLLNLLFLSLEALPAQSPRHWLLSEPHEMNHSIRARLDVTPSTLLPCNDRVQGTDGACKEKFLFHQRRELPLLEQSASRRGLLVQRRLEVQ